MSLSDDILLQIQEQQVENARVMGTMASDLSFLKTAIEADQSECRTNRAELDKRVKLLENSSYRQAGFIGGAVFVLDFLARKLRLM